MGGHGRSLRRRHRRHVWLRGQCRRRARARLELVTKVVGDWHAISHLRSVAVHGWNTSERWRHGHGAFMRRWSRDRGIVLRVFIGFGSGRATDNRGTRSQRCGSGCGSFFNSAGMMILVTGQRGPTREGLLTVGIGALVRALAGVDSTMASERTGITEGLRCAVSRVSNRVENKHVPFHIAHTCVASLRCVRADGR